MNVNRVAGLARRVITQIVRDRRTFVLLIVVPILLLLLGDLLFDSDTTTHRIGIVDTDIGVTLPGGMEIRIADLILRALEQTPSLTAVELDRGGPNREPNGQPNVEPAAALKKHRVDAVLVLKEDLSSQFISHGMLRLSLHLEGSNPAVSGILQGQITQVAVRALAAFATKGPGSTAFLPFIRSGDGKDTEDDLSLPIDVTVNYIYGTGDFDEMDYVAPVYVNFLVLFFVFLMTCVSFIRERTHGTMERLLATPATRLEIIIGYISGLSVFALLQGSIIVVFAVLVLKINFLGNVALLFLIVVLLSIVGVSLGMLASSFARTEFQVVQFIPLLIIPQLLVGGTFIQIEQLPDLLKPLAYCMPLTYANLAMRDVMLKGLGMEAVWPYLTVLVGFSAVLVVLDTVTVRREVT